MVGTLTIDVLFRYIELAPYLEMHTQVAIVAHMWSKMVATVD